MNADTIFAFLGYLIALAGASVLGYIYPIVLFCLGMIAFGAVLVKVFGE